MFTPSSGAWLPDPASDLSVKQGRNYWATADRFAGIANAVLKVHAIPLALNSTLQTPNKPPSSRLGALGPKWCTTRCTPFTSPQISGDVYTISVLCSVFFVSVSGIVRLQNLPDTRAQRVVRSALRV